MQLACGRHATVLFDLSHGLVRVCERSHMGVNNVNPDLVCENIICWPIFNWFAHIL